MNIRKAERILIGAVALHSCILGSAMLVMPIRTLSIAGWNYDGGAFFPSQSGIFLLILSGAYAAGIWHRPFAWLLVASKLAAVLFLVTSIILGTAPSMVLIPTILDCMMGLSVASLLIWNNGRMADPLRHPNPPQP